MTRSEIHRHIDQHLDEHIAHIQSWVRQPSVSWDNLGVAECAELVAESYRKLGCQEVEILPGRYHPGVWAYYDAGAPVTVHNYCMFDTRTVDAAEWSFDPWGAELVPMGPYPKALVGRGAMGAKGPYVAWLNALEAIIAVEGTLPFNVMFLAEGEEILGSPTYREFVDRYRDRLAERGPELLSILHADQCRDSISRSGSQRHDRAGTDRERGELGVWSQANRAQRYRFFGGLPSLSPGCGPGMFGG